MTVLIIIFAIIMIGIIILNIRQSDRRDMKIKKGEERNGEDEGNRPRD